MSAMSVTFEISSYLSSFSFILTLGLVNTKEKYKSRSSAFCTGDFDVMPLYVNLVFCFDGLCNIALCKSKNPSDYLKKPSLF